MSTKLVDAYHAYTKIRSIQASKGLNNRINVLYRSLDELKSKREGWTEEEKEFQVHDLSINEVIVTLNMIMIDIRLLMGQL